MDVYTHTYVVCNVPFTYQQCVGGGGDGGEVSIYKSHAPYKAITFSVSLGGLLLINPAC